MYVPQVTGYKFRNSNRIIWILVCLIMSPIRPHKPVMVIPQKRVGVGVYGWSCPSRAFNSSNACASNLKMRGFSLGD